MSASVPGKAASIKQLLAGQRTIALDTNVLIALLEDDGERADRAAALIDAIEQRVVEGVASTLLLTEVLTGPASVPDGARFERTADELRGAGLTFLAVDTAIAVEAAWIRGTRALTLPDALHLATARAAGATTFVTNDRRIRSFDELAVAYLDDLELA